MARTSEIEEYRQFTAPAELHKAINTLKGIVAGITMDYQINQDEIDELANWCVAHKHLEHRHPFNEIIPLIESIYEDGIVSEDEKKDIIWLCNNFISDSSYYDLLTSSLQFLQGLIHGIMADGIITNNEIFTLKTWIQTNEHLIGCYPFDEIKSLIIAILNDGVVTEDERNMLKAFFANFIDLTTSYNLNEIDLNSLKEQYNINGICAVCHEINFENNVFCFTGESVRAKRKEIAEIITTHGGLFSGSITNKTRYLIVGNKGNPCWAFSCYGRKIEEAINHRKKGQQLTIVNENDFWLILDKLNSQKGDTYGKSIII